MPSSKYRHLAKLTYDAYNDGQTPSKPKFSFCFHHDIAARGFVRIQHSHLSVSFYSPLIVHNSFESARSFHRFFFSIHVLDASGITLHLIAYVELVFTFLLLYYFVLCFSDHVFFPNNNKAVFQAKQSLCYGDPFKACPGSPPPFSPQLISFAWFAIHRWAEPSLFKKQNQSLNFNFLLHLFIYTGLKS